MSKAIYQLFRDGEFHMSWDEDMQDKLCVNPQFQRMHEQRLESKEEFMIAKAMSAMDQLKEECPDLAPVYDFIKDEFLKRHGND